MNEMTAQKLDIDHRMFWNALSALALGTLLGTLAVMPYDRLFGLSGPICDALRSLVALAALSSLGIGRKAHLTFEAKGIPEGALEPSLPRRERAGTALRGLFGNLNRLSNVLRVQWSTGHPSTGSG